MNENRTRIVRGVCAALAAVMLLSVVAPILAQLL